MRCLSLAAVAVAVLIAGAAARAAEPVYSFPPVDALPDQPTMPDPFRKPDGSRVTTPAEWPAQRAYLKALLQHYLYGRLPPRPDASQVSVTCTSDEPYTPPDSTVAGRKQGYRIDLARNGLVHSFTFNLWRPEPKRRYPVLINNHPEHHKVGERYGMGAGVRRGYAVVEYERNEVAPDDKNNADRHEGVFHLYPEYDFYTIGAWAWTYQIVIDVLDRLEVADMKKIIATGVSRGGFTAMAGAIFDDRIAMAAPAAAGPFSTGSVRQRDPESFRGTADYPTIILRQFPHWFHPRYLEFKDRPNKMPWDAPTLVALVAPRPLIDLSSLGDGLDNWLGKEVGIRAGMCLYEWFGAGTWCRIHWRDLTNAYGQKGHDEGPEEFNAIFDYADEYFFGRPRGPSTFNVMPNHTTWHYDPAQYPLLMDWLPPGRP